MKKLILSLTLIVAVFTSAYSETVEVDISKLSAQELQLYQKMKVRESEISLTDLTPEKIDSYAQIGRAFGSAFKECWTTVSNDAEKFANSSAGKWAMVLVSWKIMGRDAVGLVTQTVQFVCGISLLFVGTAFFIYIFRRNCVRIPQLVSKTKICFLTVKKEYKGLTDPAHDNEAMILYAICYACFIGVCCLIMFC